MLAPSVDLASTTFADSLLHPVSPFETLLTVRNLSVEFDTLAQRFLPWRKPTKLKALSNISFDLGPSETLGVVGESGCGKTTLTRALMNLIPRVEGDIFWQGKPLASDDTVAWQELRQKVQIVFQDPFGALDPRMKIGNIIAEPLRLHYPYLPNADVHKRVLTVMQRTGLQANMVHRYPHEFSGGQCQRINIARALVTNPQVLICDEPLSALDVSIQAQIVNLLKSLQREMGLSLIFIAHDLAIVKHIADRVMVLYMGRILEIADKHSLYRQPLHPYTQALLSAAPSPNPKTERRKVIPLLAGELPSPLHPPSGCVFRTRCPQAEPLCATICAQLSTLPPPPHIAQVNLESHQAIPHQVACWKVSQQRPSPALV